MIRYKNPREYEGFFIMKYSPVQKIFFIVAVITLTFFYARYERGKIEVLTSPDNLLILQKIPEFIAKEMDTNNVVSDKTLLAANAAGIMVHFWGTWCAPCEAEFPEMIKFSESLEGSNVKILLLAVNDQEDAVKKFLKRFGELPKNTIVAIDQDGASLEKFGTVKVPETYYFNSQGKNLRKFVGPQEWDKPYYKSQVLRLLGQSETVKVESH